MIAGDTSAVPITPVIASKCSVNVLGAGARYGANGDNVQNPYRESSPYVSSLTGTTLSIRANASSGDGGTVSWEVVEYY
jgi:hypothetical protein